MLTEQVRLLDGVAYGGKRHVDVVMRVPIVKDSLEAEAESEGKGALHLSLALLAKHIVSFGNIPKEKITVDLLAMLSDSDFQRLTEVRDFLLKKNLWIPRD